MTIKSKLLTTWTLFFLMFVGCEKPTPYQLPQDVLPKTVVSSASSGDRYIEIKEVQLNGLVYIVASGYHCVSVIPKPQMKLEKE